MSSGDRKGISTLPSDSSEEFDISDCEPSEEFDVSETCRVWDVSGIMGLGCRMAAGNNVG
jgi:hypothetical protein